MLRPLIKLLRLGGLIVSGLVLALFFYPGMDRAARDRKLMAWASRLMAILEIDVQVCGAIPRGELLGALPQSGVVLVANHVSWLDIHVLHSLLPARFISKAEVRHWPLLGRLALAAGTLFISREKKSDAIRVNQAMAAELQAGECLAFFPEATTTDGRGLRPFFPSLFQPAVDAGCSVVPAAIRYFDKQGEPCLAAAYYGEMTLLASIWRIVRIPGLRVEITFLPALTAQGMHRRELAKQAEAAIRAALGLAA